VDRPTRHATALQDQCAIFIETDGAIAPSSFSSTIQVLPAQVEGDTTATSRLHAACVSLPNASVRGNLTISLIRLHSMIRGSAHLKFTRLHPALAAIWRSSSNAEEMQMLRVVIRYRRTLTMTKRRATDNALRQAKPWTRQLLKNLQHGYAVKD